MLTGRGCASRASRAQGATWTAADRLTEALEPLRGHALLTVDADARWRDQLAALPAVARRTVETVLPDRVEAVTVEEEAAAFVWQTSAVRWSAPRTARLIGQVALGRRAARRPRRRCRSSTTGARGSRNIIVGDPIPSRRARAPRLRLVGIEPAALGSTAPRLTRPHRRRVRLHRSCPGSSGWQAAFGYYGLDPQEDDADAAARIEQQVARGADPLRRAQPEASVSVGRCPQSGEGILACQDLTSGRAPAGSPRHDLRIGLSRMWLPLVGLALGVALGLALNVNVSPDLARYSAVGILAGLDSVLGAIRAELDAHYDNRVFITGFVTNALVAVALTFVGDRLGIDLYLVALFAFGLRIFQNVALIRRHFL